MTRFLLALAKSTKSHHQIATGNKFIRLSHSPRRGQYAAYEMMYHTYYNSKYSVTTLVKLEQMHYATAGTSGLASQQEIVPLR